jgi:hypothetical protein
VPLDLRSAAATGLFALGTVQLLRGQVLAPAVTLFWYGLEGLTQLRAQASLHRAGVPGSAFDAMGRE